MERKSWNDAKRYCELNEQAELVTIEDAFEQSYLRLIAYIASSDAWIGLIKVKVYRPKNILTAI
jgi:hypothetical protein